MTKKILYVEDEPDIQTIALLALETVGGFTVKVCSSGEEALREVAGFAPDIILLDVMMPGMDGIDTFQKLRQQPQYASLPVVFMTARLTDYEIQHYRDLGAVDVIGKPFDPMALPNQVYSILNNLNGNKSVKQQQLKQQLDTLRATYIRELPSKVAAIKDDWQRLKNQTDGKDANSLLRKVHSLSGSGATFDLPAVSKAAQRLEEALRVKSPADGEDFDYQKALDELVDALEKAAIDSVQDKGEARSNMALPKQHDNKIKRLLLICDNYEEANSLCDQLNHFAIRTVLAGSVPDLIQKIATTGSDVILVEGGKATGLQGRIDKMEQIQSQFAQEVSVIVVSADDTMDSRLSAVRSGAAAYFLSPVKIADLIDFIRIQHLSKDTTPYRILIIDDDAQQANHTALILMQAGMEISVVTHPMRALDVIISFQPELILMDLYMPECSGLELATVIRQYDNYTGIAIVFFSIDSDIDRHIDALRVGGDEYIVKSLSTDRLLAKVEARVKRSRIIQRLMLRDSLTGLFNRSYMDEHLQLEVNKIKRLSGCFSYVILDLDHFKLINDLYGHVAGDEVLKSLALFLLQSLRAIDLVGRYGGEEIVIILPGTSAVRARLLVNKLLDSFSALKFTGKDNEFKVTFSAGIAEFPYFNNVAALTEAADKALYQAKEEGRNRVYVATMNKP